MFEIEAHNMVTCTCKISDENEIKIREYIKKHPDEFQYCSDEEAIIIAIKKLEIDLYSDYVETDSCTTDVQWSEYEERPARNIIEGK